MKQNMYETYYLNQAGFGGLPYYKGSPYQRGYGLGGILGGVMRTIVPMLKSTGKTLLREGLKTGTGILADAIDGQNIKESASSRFRQSARRLARTANQHLSDRLQSNPEPRPNTIKRKRVQTNNKKRRVRRKRDIFG